MPITNVYERTANASGNFKDSANGTPASGPGRERDDPTVQNDGEIVDHAVMEPLEIPESDDVAPPVAPATPTIASLSDIQARLTWRSVDQADTYRLARRESGKIWQNVYDGANLSYVDTGLEPVTRYEYRVSARNGGGDSEWSNSVTALTKKRRPSQPAELKPIVVSLTQINLSWTPDDAAEYYVLSRSPDGINDWTIIYAGSMPAFVDAPLAPETWYYYRVLGRNTTADSSWSDVIGVQTVATIPDSPDALRLQTVSETSAVLIWEHSFQADTYVLERSEDGETNWEIAYSGKENRFVDASLQSAHHYYYRLKAVSAFGESPYTAVLHVKTDGAPRNEPGVSARGFARASRYLVEIAIHYRNR